MTKEEQEQFEAQFIAVFGGVPTTNHVGETVICLPDNSDVDAKAFHDMGFPYEGEDDD